MRKSSRLKKLRSFEYLDKFIVALPPEPDEHWHEKSLESPLWNETRRKVREAIVRLEELNDHPESRENKSGDASPD